LTPNIAVTWSYEPGNHGMKLRSIPKCLVGALLFDSINLFALHFVLLLILFIPCC